MTTERQAAEIPDIDEASWVYLAGSGSSAPAIRGLREQVVEVCKLSGWATVSCSAEERVGPAADPGHFFESVSHAVEQADVVVALIGAGTEISEAELALAYAHGRPVVGVQMSGHVPAGSGAHTMLREYGRARLITCASPEECAISLRQALADPEFAETIREAS